jgi:hypothetical protein
MRLFYLTLAFRLCAVFCHVQTAINDATVLKQTRAKYDVPFERNLHSFSCAVEFNWKQHFTEAVRLGDEGTDEEIAKLMSLIMSTHGVPLQDRYARAHPETRRSTRRIVFPVEPCGLRYRVFRCSDEWRFFDE